MIDHSILYAILGIACKTILSPGSYVHIQMYESVHSRLSEVTGVLAIITANTMSTIVSSRKL